MKRIIIGLTLLCCATLATAQISISDAGIDPDSSAMLDVQSTDKGVLVPRMDSTQRLAITNPAFGLLVFETDTESFWYRDSTTWIQIRGGDVRPQGLLLDEECFLDTVTTATYVIPPQLPGASPLDVTGGEILWQSFTAEVNGYITLAGIKIESSNVNCSFRLYTGEGTAGSILYEDPINETWNAGWNTVNLPYDSIFLEKDSVYTIWFNDPDEFDMEYKNGNPYSGGRASSGAGHDFNFLVQVTNCNPHYVVDPTTPLGTTNLNHIDSLYFSDGTFQTTATPTLIQDADADTKIQVEESPDEDVIRFDIDGVERFKMETLRLSFMNTNKSVSIGRNAWNPSNYSIGNPYSNTFVGDEAGAGTEGSFNTGIGVNALRGLVPGGNGRDNTGIGMDALAAIVDGDENTAVGSNSLGFLESGSYNTGIGNNAGSGIESGEQNALLGYFAGGGGNSSKSYVTAIGYKAGQNNNGNRNVFLGHQAGRNSSGSDRLYIENSETDSTAALIFGNFADDLLRINGTLNLNGAFSFPTSDGTAGQVLATDGSGNLSWGFNKILQDADADTKIQVEKSADEDVIRFDLGGDERWQMKATRLEPVNSGSSIFIGTEAGMSDDLSGNKTIYIGNEAGRSHVNSVGSVAIGDEAFKSGTAGLNNVAIGNKSMSNSEGNFNVALGTSTLRINTNGNNNTAIGYSAGEASVGSGNVFIGFRSGISATGDNKLYITNSNTNSPLVYGEFDNNLLRINGTLDINNAYSFPTTDGTAGQILETDGTGGLSWQDQNWIESGTDIYSAASGNVGIGTSTPNAKLNVVGDIRSAFSTFSSGYLQLSNDSDYGYLDYEPYFSSTVGDFKIRMDGSDAIHIKKTGQVGIGASPVASNQLTVGGNIDASGDLEFGASDHNPVAYDRKTVMVSGKIMAGGNHATGVTSSSYINSATKTATGQYTITFSSGTFSNEPIVTITALHDGSNANRYAVIDSISLSAGVVTLMVEIRNAAGSLQDGPFNFIAIGEE